MSEGRFSEIKQYDHISQDNNVIVALNFSGIWLLFCDNFIGTSRDAYASTVIKCSEFH